MSLEAQDVLWGSQVVQDFLHPLPGEGAGAYLEVHGDSTLDCIPPPAKQEAQYK